VIENPTSVDFNQDLLKNIPMISVVPKLEPDFIMGDFT
jgi:hypothetical protein